MVTATKKIKWNPMKVSGEKGIEDPYRAVSELKSECHEGTSHGKDCGKGTLPHNSKLWAKTSLELFPPAPALNPGPSPVQGGPTDTRPS